MKTNLKRFFVFAIAGLMVIPAFESCKKGEEDPWLTFRGRDQRITGTWQLSSVEYNREQTTVTTTTNSVNDDQSVTTLVETMETTYDGSRRTEVDQEVETTEVTLDSQNPNTAPDDTEESESTTDIYDFSVEITIDKDNTYSVTYTESQISKEECDKPDDDIEECTTTTYDENSSEWTEEGTWHWEDSKNRKVIINAGPLQGKLLRLSNKNLIIEEESNTTSTDVDVMEDFAFYEDYSSGDDEEGDRTRREEVETTTSYNAEWEKQ